MAAHPSRRTRPAYTFMEMVLVAALISILAGAATPIVMSMYAKQRVDAAVDAVRAAWARAKAESVREGRPYRFCVVMGKGNFRLAPDREAYWSGGDAPADDQEGAGVVRDDQLPPGVVFSKPGELATNSSNETVVAGQVSPSQWSNVAVFQPDGTAREDIEITFSFKGARPVVVHLRAMTGVVTVKPQGSN